MLPAKSSHSNPALVTIENRSARRRRVLKGARASIKNGQFDFPCTVRDISDTGARLAVKDGYEFPSKFELQIDLDGVAVPCRIVRRGSLEVAVAFLAAPRQVAPPRVQVITQSYTPVGASLRRKPIAA